MIGYLRGTLLSMAEDRVLLLVRQVGYEVYLPAFVHASVNAMAPGEELAFYIYYHQTERQPTPVLIGFHHELEKEFFQSFISVEAIGPLKALKALDRPIQEVALAIESNDAATLKRLKGIGERTAHKIIATLGGKMGRFVEASDRETFLRSDDEDMAAQVLEVLVEQLGHRVAEARAMIGEAMACGEAIDTPEALLEAIFRRKRR